MIKFKNYTPHTIEMNDGTRYKSEGVCRVKAVFSEPNTDNICITTYGNIEGLPAKEPYTYFIVSIMVLNANAKLPESERRYDLVAPATGHPNTIRNSEGLIMSVPCFISE